MFSRSFYCMPPWLLFFLRQFFYWLNGRGPSETTPDRPLWREERCRVSVLRMHLQLCDMVPPLAACSLALQFKNNNYCSSSSSFFSKHGILVRDGAVVPAPSERAAAAVAADVGRAAQQPACAGRL